MSKSNFSFKAKASIIDQPSCPVDKVEATINRVGPEVSRQDDLSYIRAVLVTTGANDNNDVFGKEQLWASRLSPVDKPINWDHNRTKIIGHIYSVTAKTLDGQDLDTDKDEPTLSTGEKHDGDFELVVEGVVYSFLLPEFSNAIRHRANAGQLFVSMEAWFDDFDFVLWNSNTASKAAALFDNTEFEVLPRDEHQHLNEHLLSAGGNGKVEGRDVGRLLKNVLFGGMGFVGVPANPRSKIEQVDDTKIDNVITQQHEDKTIAKESGDGWTHEFVINFIQFDDAMSSSRISGNIIGRNSVDQAISAWKNNVSPRLPNLVQSAIEAYGIDANVDIDPLFKELTTAENERKVEYFCRFNLLTPERENEDMDEKGSSPSVVADKMEVVLATGLHTNQEVEMGNKEASAVTNDSNQAELLEALDTLRAEREDLKVKLATAEAEASDKARLTKIDALFKAIAQPEEIRKIDEAIRSGEDPFAAKLAFLQDSLRRFTSAQKELEDTKGMLEEYVTKERMREVRALRFFSDDRLNKIEKKIGAMTNEEFEDWIGEHREVAEKYNELKNTQSADEPDDTNSDDDATVTAALDNAEPEDEVDLSNATQSNTDSDDSEDQVYNELAGMLTDPETPRIKRLRKKRGAQFGRS